APETIIFSFLIIGLFLVKKHLKERLYIIGSSLAAIIVSSFWLIPFLIASTDSIITTDTYALGEVLFNAWKFEPLTFIISIIIPLALFLLFYLNWQKNKSKDYFLFYLPLLFLNLIFLLRIYPFIPLLKNIHPDIFHHFLLFFVIFFFLKLDLEKFSTNWKKMLFILFNLGVILSVTISLIHTPWFTEHTESDKETLELFDYINGRYLIYGSNGSYTYAYYSYIPIYLDLPSASGWYPHMLSVEYKQLLKDSSDTLKEKDCEGFKNSLSALNVTDILAYNEFCDSLDICNLNKKADKNIICVYSYY
ncbi:MAG: hypothetical protein L6408_04235, partial [Nanoarchaeota archaeon]|nr:hypothetical protein [Nanoarchaeota archaeon]